MTVTQEDQMRQFARQVIKELDAKLDSMDIDNLGYVNEMLGELYQECSPVDANGMPVMSAEMEALVDSMDLSDGDDEEE